MNTKIIEEMDAREPKAHFNSPTTYMFECVLEDTHMPEYMRIRGKCMLSGMHVDTLVTLHKEERLSTTYINLKGYTFNVKNDGIFYEIPTESELTTACC